ncbi:unnamed protein product [Auanema sp. JU1783]|nr:unnamed protein product [Auanema sp. JU1783]
MKEIRLICIFGIIGLASSAKILFANTWQSKSHALTMLPLAERLHDRGNDVTMYSLVTSSIGKLGNKIKSIETLLPDRERFSDTSLVHKLFWFFEMSPVMLDEPHYIGWQYLNSSKDEESLKDILSTCYDLVIVDEMFSTAQAAIAFYLNQKCSTKITIFSTTDLFAHVSQLRALSRNPITYPNYYLKGYHVSDFSLKSFRYRLYTVMDVMIEPIFLGYLSNRLVKSAGDLIGTTASQTLLYEKNFMTFIDYPRTYGMPVTKSNEMIYVSEYCSKTKPLDQEFLKILEDKSSKGTIYVAFGSIVSWEAGPPEVLQTFVKVFNKLTDYRVIWSYGGPEIKNLKPHIHLSKWTPQNDILSHPNTVLFFTHGGLKSLKEGICAKTPMLFMPFFADQPRNAWYATYMGIAEAIYKKNVTEVELESKINKVLLSTTMKSKVEKYHRIYLDNIVDPIDVGAFWAEKSIKFTDSSRKYMSIHGKQLYWMQYLYSEIVILLSIVFFVVKS